MRNSEIKRRIVEALGDLEWNEAAALLRELLLEFDPAHLPPAAPDVDDVEGARSIIRSIRRTVPAEDMLKRVRPVGSDLSFGDRHPSAAGGR